MECSQLSIDNHNVRCDTAVLSISLLGTSTECSILVQAQQCHLQRLPAGSGHSAATNKPAALLSGCCPIAGVLSWSMEQASDICSSAALCLYQMVLWVVTTCTALAQRNQSLVGNLDSIVVGRRHAPNGIKGRLVSHDSSEIPVLNIILVHPVYPANASGCFHVTLKAQWCVCAPA